MLDRNPGSSLDLGWVQSSYINHEAIKQRANELKTSRPVVGQHRIAWLLKAVSLIDLTTLSGDDTESNVSRLCHKAAHPLSPQIDAFYDMNEILPHGLTTAAVCVYPAKVSCAVETLNKIKLNNIIQVAAVATGFPSGQYPLSTRLGEISWTVSQGATEIDIVIDRSLVITGKWQQLYDELKAMREACGSAHMKAILAVGELNNITNIYKASLVAMMAGADFIKTSTGKEAINATLPVGVVMSRAIMDYYSKTGYQVGLKPAGGISTADEALAWLVLVKEELGDSWLKPELFRFGASSLLGSIEKQLYIYATSRNPADYQFTL